MNKKYLLRCVWILQYLPSAYKDKPEFELINPKYLLL